MTTLGTFESGLQSSLTEEFGKLGAFVNRIESNLEDSSELLSNAGEETGIKVPSFSISLTKENNNYFYKITARLPEPEEVPEPKRIPEQATSYSPPKRKIMGIDSPIAAINAQQDLERTLEEIEELPTSETLDRPTEKPAQERERELDLATLHYDLENKTYELVPNAALMDNENLTITREKDIMGTIEKLMYDQIPMPIKWELAEEVRRSSQARLSSQARRSSAPKLQL